MKQSKIFQISFLVIYMLLTFAYTAEAKKVLYFFDGIELTKTEEVAGKMERMSYCKNKISMQEIGISAYTVQAASDDIYVSPDERYFVFHGSLGSQSRWLFFLTDIANCKVIRELTIDEKYDPFNYSAAFSPNSEALYITWHVLDKNGTGLLMTKEYGGEEFKSERILMNIVIPHRAGDGKGFYDYFFKFSHNAKYLIAVNKKTWESTIYLVSDDKKAGSFKIRDYTKNKYFPGEYVPDIENGVLLYNFNIDAGTEIDMYDYLNKKKKNRIVVLEKGLGKLMPSGATVIFSSFPLSKTAEKNIIVYEALTGKVIGKTILNADDEVVDFRSDANQIIYKRHNIEKRSEIK